MFSQCVLSRRFCFISLPLFFLFSSFVSPSLFLYRANCYAEKFHVRRTDKGRRCFDKLVPTSATLFVEFLRLQTAVAKPMVKPLVKLDEKDRRLTPGCLFWQPPREDVASHTAIPNYVPVQHKKKKLSWWEA